MFGNLSRFFVGLMNRLRIGVNIHKLYSQQNKRKKQQRTTHKWGLEAFGASLRNAGKKSYYIVIIHC